MIYLHKKMYRFDIDTLPKTEVFRNTTLIDPNMPYSPTPYIYIIYNKKYTNYFFKLLY